MIDSSTHSRSLDLSVRSARSSRDATSLGDSDRRSRTQQQITESMLGKKDPIQKTNEKSREKKLAETARPSFQPLCKYTGAEDQSICKAKSDLRKGPRNEPSSHKKRSSPTRGSSASDSRCQIRSSHERITRFTTTQDDPRSVGSIKRRPRSLSRERSKDKARDMTQSVSSTQTMSLLESLSELKFVLGEGDDDEDQDLQFSTQTSTRLKYPTNFSDTAPRPLSRRPQEVAQSSGLLVRKDEHGKHTPYRSKFRNQYGATGVVEMECMASVKAVKSIFEKNRDENDLMRISKMRSKEMKERQGQCPPALPLHQSRKHKSDDDDISVSLASLVGNIALPDSSHGFSQQSFDLVSFSPACSSRPRAKAAPSSNLPDRHFPLQNEEKTPGGNLKTKTNKSQEFLEKLSLKKAKQDGHNRKLRGRVRRSKRTDNMDEESCYETEDDTVVDNDDVDKCLPSA